jgi:hypothetical protein
MKPTLIDAILHLVPNAQVVVRGQDIEWLEQPANKPTDAELASQVALMTVAYDNAEYQRQRASEYPPFADYLDGIVKGDSVKVQAYKNACLAVKAKYPKPE